MNTKAILVIVGIVMLVCTLVVGVRAELTNCSTTTVTFSSGDDGFIFGVAIYLLIGFATLLFTPKIIGTPDVMTGANAWKALMNDAFKRACYIMAVTVYYLAGAFLYISSVDVATESEWLFTLLTTLFSVFVFVMISYMMFKVVQDVINMIKLSIAAKEYGRDVTE